MSNIGFIGWRGMVGSVLMERMVAERDFDGVNASFFSTSQAGEPGPSYAGAPSPLLDANDVSALSEFDVLVSCQGGDYTNAVYPQLRATGWKGYWIDAASALRMEDSSIIVLDPVNRSHIDQALDDGIKDYIGGNCTVSLMLMAIAGLYQADVVEWVSAMTYQAASGAGAKSMRELVSQMHHLGESCQELLGDPRSAILDIDRQLNAAFQSDTFPQSEWDTALAGSLIPWIDKRLDNGQTREEWKAQVEASKILGQPATVDGICVRIGAMRCHSQALTIKLKRDIPLSEIEQLIDGANDWVSLVPNEVEDSRASLSPVKVSGTLSVPIGRLRKLNMGPKYLSAFTVGDQLLWGAAEPLRRMLRILRER